MACKVCGEGVNVCENCCKELDGEFFCFQEVHFCSQSCWKDWLIEEERENLHAAEDDEK